MTLKRSQLTLLFLFQFFISINTHAQDCAPALSGPGVSTNGYAVQGKNDCFMAADVNGGIRGGHEINPNCGGRCDEAITTPDGAMDAVRVCLQTKGYAEPGKGTLDGKDGFSDALCKCNEIVFGKKFVCDQMSGAGIHPGDLQLLEELLGEKCIIIVTLRLFIPLSPATPHIGGFGNHAVTLTGTTMSPPSISLSDPNNPDQTSTLPVNSDGTIPQSDLASPDHPLPGGVVPQLIQRVTIKCPLVEENASPLYQVNESTHMHAPNSLGH